MWKKHLLQGKNSLFLSEKHRLTGKGRFSYRMVWTACTLLGDAEPVDVCPSAVVSLDGGASAEGTYLGTYPFAFPGLEGIAQLLETLSVEAIAEVAHYHKVVTAFALGYLLVVTTEFDAQIDGWVGQGGGGVDLFGCAFFESTSPFSVFSRIRPA